MASLEQMHKPKPTLSECFRRDA